jgi:predicted dehydrogenase
MRLGMIGFGGIAQGAHLGGWQARQRAGKAVELTIYDIDPAKREQARAMDVGTVVDTLEELLARVDVVDICTPSDTHADLVRTAARAGKHVLSEKPLAMTVDDAVDAARVCRDAGVTLHVGHVVRFIGQYSVAHDALLAGQIGEPSVLRFRRAGAQPSSNDWMEIEERSGGVVLDLMIHDIDQARWFAGEVVRVFGRSAKKGRGGINTHALAILTHASGAITHLTGSWGLAAGFEVSYEIAGTGGLVSYDSRDQVPVHADKPELLERTEIIPVALGDSPFATELNEFADVIEGGPTARVAPGDAIAAVAIANAVRRSIASGQPEEPEPVPDDLASGSASAGSRAATGTWM